MEDVSVLSPPLKGLLARTFRGRPFAFALAALAALPVPSAGQQAGSLRVRVVADGGEAIPGVFVTLEQSGLEAAVGRTDRDGWARFNRVEPGVLSLRVEALGYRPAVVTPVWIVTGETTTVEASLIAGVPPFTTLDSVRGPPAPSRLSAVSSGVSGRELQEFPALEPGAGRAPWTTPRVDRSLGLEGLPSGLTRTWIDGIPVGAGGVSHGPLRTRSRLPRLGIGQVEFLVSGGRMSSPMGAGGAFAETTGWPAGAVAASLEWLPAGAVQGPGEPPDLASGYSVGAVGQTSVSPTLRIGGALEVNRVDVPGASVLNANTAALLPPVMGGVELSTLTSDRIRQLEDVRAVGRLGWRRDGRSLTISGGVADGSDPGAGPQFSEGAYGWSPATDRRSMWLGSTFETPVAPRAVFRFRLGYDRDEAEPSTVLGTLPASRIVSTGDEFGWASMAPQLQASSGIFLSPAVRFDLQDARLGRLRSPC